MKKSELDNEIKKEQIEDFFEKKPHASFKRRFKNDWRDYFLKKDVLLKVLDGVCLTATHEFVTPRSKYLIDDDRLAVTLLLKRKGTEILDKVIIDAISSWPSFEQIMEVLYTLGSDCDYRIVLYDRNFDSDCWGDHSGDIAYMFDSLLDYLQGRVSLSVVGIDLGASDGGELTPRCMKIRSINRNNTQLGLPDRTILEEAELWSSYFPGIRCQGEHYDEYCFHHGEYVETTANKINSWAIWTDDGMVAEYTMDGEYFKELMSKRLDRLESRFKGCLIDYRIEDQEITVKNRAASIREAVESTPVERKHGREKHIITITSPIPFRNFVYSSPDDRYGMADEFVCYASAAREIEDWEYDKE